MATVGSRRAPAESSRPGSSQGRALSHTSGAETRHVMRSVRRRALEAECSPPGPHDVTFSSFLVQLHRVGALAR